MNPLLIFALLLGLPSAAALDNGLGRVPPLGWSSWNSFVDVALNETIVRETADAMVSSGLQAAGYQYINVDCGWSALNRTADGDITPDPERFPSGMKALGDYIHSKGLLFGLYTARGPRECCGRLGYNGSMHAERDAHTFAAWGVDYLKIDSCGKQGAGPFNMSEWDQFAVMRDALNATGRPIYVSVCETAETAEPGPSNLNGGPDCGAGVYSPKMWFAQGRDVSTLGNSILVEYSNNGNSFEAVQCTMQAQRELTFDNLTQPGAWNDNDMSTIGCSDHHVNLGWTPCINHKDPMSDTEGRAQFNLFVIQAAPLILGNDIRHMGAGTAQTLLNTEALAVNQDPAGHRGALVRQLNNGSLSLYVKKLSSGPAQRALAVINTLSEPAAVHVQLAWLELGDGPWGTAELRDVWRHAPVGHLSGGFTVTVEPRGSILYTATLSA